MSQKFILRGDLKFIPQPGFHKWRCVVEDPREHKFFRMGRNEYIIASMMDVPRTLAEIYERVVKSPDGKHISPQLVQATVRWLLGNKLIYPEGAPPPNPFHSHIHEAQTTLGPVGDPFSFRLPLVQGATLEAFVQKWLWLASPPAIVVCVLIQFMAAMTFLMDPQKYTRMSINLFVPDSICWWFAAWLIMKTLHEAGHAVVCVKHGSSLRMAGLAFFYLAPVPYVDTTDMWRLGNRYSRLYCASAGVFTELTVASLGLLACSLIDNHAIQYLCISLATLGTISTLVFNGNPLARFDGYYVLADLLDRPSLWTDGRLAARQFFRFITLSGRAQPNASWWILAVYGIVCILYRWVVMIGLAWGAWTTWQGIGLILMGVAGYFWFVAPWIKRFKQGGLQWNYREYLQGWTFQRASASGLLVVLSIAAILMIPSPFQPMSPGIVTLNDPVVIRSECDGILQKVFAHDGESVEEGMTLATVENHQLHMTLQKLRIELEMSDERARACRAEMRMAEMQSEQAKSESLRKQIEQVEKQVQSLEPIAPRSGRFVSRQITNRAGQFLKSGEPIGTIIANDRLEVQVSIAQVDVAAYRGHLGKRVLLYRESGRPIQGTLREVLPRYTDTLDHPSLAAKYGGPIAVKMESSSNDKGGLKTLKPRNIAKIEIDPSAMHGMAAGEHCSVLLAEHPQSLAEVGIRLLKKLRDWILPATQHA
ncbi:MAG: HlyD family efflux transporter periplasmic adaptor subunit [Pirellulales bacterium]